MNEEVNPMRKIKGAVLILVASMMLVIIGFGAAAIDFSYVFLVKNELQKAADYAALAGSLALYTPDSLGNPMWANAENAARNMLVLNRAAEAALADATIETGYYPLTGGGNGNVTASPNGPNDGAAIKVTISKGAGENGGPINLFFGSIFGIPTVDVSAASVAAVGGPSGVGAGQVFPFAISKNTYDSYWDPVTKTPLIDPNTGQSYLFEVAEGPGGNWTTFADDTNSVPAIRALFESKNPTPVAIGDYVYTAPGTKTALYKDVPVGVEVTIVIVEDSGPGDQRQVIGFGSVYIDGSYGKKDKYVEVRITSGEVVPDSVPGGPDLGIYSKPKLAY